MPRAGLWDQLESLIMCVICVMPLQATLSRMTSSLIYSFLVKGKFDEPLVRQLTFGGKHRRCAARAKSVCGNEFEIWHTRSPSSGE